MKGSDIRAGGAFVELFAKDRRLIASLNAAGARLRAFGATVAGIGVRLAGVGFALVAPFALAAKRFADMGSDMLDMSQRTGLGVEALSELRYAAEQSGATAEDLEAALRTMSRTVGSGGMAIDQRVEQIADELAGIPDPAARAARAMEIFGRGGTRLLPLFAQGAEGIRALRREAQRTGNSMRQEDAEAAEVFGDALSRLWSGVRGLVFAIGAGLAPVLHNLADLMMGAVTSTRQWLDANRGMVQLVALLTVGVIGLGIAMALLGPIISGVGVVIGATMTALSLLYSALMLIVTIITAPMTFAIGFLVASIVAAGAIFTTFGAVSSGAIATLGNAFEELRGIAATAIGGIMDALSAGDIAGAMRIAWTGIRAAWAVGIMHLRLAWNQFSGWMMARFDEALVGIIRIFLGGIAAIEQAMQNMFAQVGLEFPNLMNEAMGTLEQWLKVRQQARDENTIHQLWKDANAAARARAELEAAVGGAGWVKDRPGDFSRDRKPPTVAALQRIDVAGGFSNRAIAGLGFSDRLAERTARAGEETARNTGRIAARVEAGGGIPVI